MVDALAQTAHMVAMTVPGLDDEAAGDAGGPASFFISDPAVPAPGLDSAAEPLPGTAAAAAAPRQETSHILKMKGLPYSTTEESVLQFFQGFQVTRVAFVQEPDGRPSGLAFAEFESKEEALRALSKNGEYIGERYVRLLHVPKTEMDEQVRLGTLAIPGAAAKLRTRLMRAQQRSTYLNAPLQLGQPGSMQPGGGGVRPLMGPGGFNGGQLPLDARGGWPGNFPPGGQYGAPARPGFAPGQGQYVGQGYPGMAAAPGGYPGQGAGGGFQGQQGGGPAGGYPGQLPGQQPGLPAGYPQGGGYPGGAQGGAQGGGYPQQLPAGLAAQFGALGLGNGAGNGAGGHARNGSAGGFVPLGGAGGGLQAPGAGGAGGGQMGGFNPALRSAAPQPAPSSSSATVKIRGLPYRASPAEILAFFSSCHFLPDSLQIGLDSMARPSGEAWLTFASPSEALRAVRDLNRGFLASRYLELSVC